MNKVYGSPRRQDGLYKVGRDKWELIYGFGKDNESNETGWNWRERFTGGKPTPETIRATIVAQINAETDRRILEGFRWQGIPVWLSQENQLNYARIERLGAEWPLRLKLGEDAEGKALYYTFTDAEEFEDFSRQAALHVIGCVQDGWKEKDEASVMSW